jgi:hypothetical protein
VEFQADIMARAALKGRGEFITACIVPKLGRAHQAAVPAEKSIWHAQREVNGVDHRLVEPSSTDGSTPTRASPSVSI